MKLNIGQGWSWEPIKDIYCLNNGEFCVTRDVVNSMAKDWGRNTETVHLIAILQRIYRIHMGLPERS